MITIAINSATRQTSVALLQANKVLAEKSWSSKRDEAEKIMPAIVSMLKKTKKDWGDVEAVLVVNGPGPFTGLRVGVTIANTIAWTQNIPIKTTTVFEYLHSRIAPKIQKKSAILVKGGGDYVAFSASPAQKEKLITFQTLPGIINRTKCRHILAEMDAPQIVNLKKVLKEQKISVHFLTSKELKSFGKTCLQLLKKNTKNTHLAKPLYLQKPHITLSKKPTYT